MVELVWGRGRRGGEDRACRWEGKGRRKVVMDERQLEGAGVVVGSAAVKQGVLGVDGEGLDEAAQGVRDDPSCFWEGDGRVTDLLVPYAGKGVVSGMSW